MIGSVENKIILAHSQAGLRFIAQMTLYNRGDFERLRAFVAENYDTALLAAESGDERLRRFREAHRTLGRVRVRELISAEKYRIVVLLEAEKDDRLYYTRLKVAEDYPHPVVQHLFRPHGAE